MSIVPTVRSESVCVQNNMATLYLSACTWQGGRWRWLPRQELSGGKASTNVLYVVSSCVCVVSRRIVAESMCACVSGRGMDLAAAAAVSAAACYGVGGFDCSSGCCCCRLFGVLQVMAGCVELVNVSAACLTTRA